MTQTRGGDRKWASVMWWRRASRAVGVLAIAAAAFGPVGGCSERLLRENVLATTQGTVGIMLAQNPQTQVYELKIGGARNEFFLVPTGKRLVSSASNDAAGDVVSKLADRIPTTSDGSAGGRMTAEEMARFVELLKVIKEMEHNDAGTTPEVLAEIQVNGRAKQTLNGEQGGRVDVYQRLAVGREAVRTPAAVALMANDPETARSLANPVRGGALTSIVNTMPDLLRDLNTAESKATLAALDREAALIPVAAEGYRLFDWNKATSKLTPRSKPVPAKFETFADAGECLKGIQESAKSLRFAVEKGDDQNIDGRAVTAIELGAMLRTYDRAESALEAEIARMPSWLRAVSLLSRSLGGN